MTSRTFWEKWGRLLFCLAASVPATVMLFGVFPYPGMFFDLFVLRSNSASIAIPAALAVDFASSFAFFWWLLSFATDLRSGNDDVGSVPAVHGPRRWWRNGKFSRFARIVITLAVAVPAAGMIETLSNWTTPGTLLVHYVLVRPEGMKDVGRSLFASIGIDSVMCFGVIWWLWSLPRRTKRNERGIGHDGGGNDTRE
jgi:hypothetical protein